MLNVEMLSTGDEVLYGQIVDTNAAWLADYCFNQGLPMTRRNTVGDSLEDLVAVLQERSHHADILIVNGGLGPTSDDLSALAAATAAGDELVMHPAWLAKMEAFFAERGRPMASSNRKQAEIPASAEMIDNPVGTACGFALKLNRCWMCFTPGVPSEFKAMVEKEIFPRIRRRFTLPEPPVCLRLTTFGRAESELAQELNPLSLPEGAVMGYRSSMPIIELKLTGPASQREAMEQVWESVRDVAGKSLIFEGTLGLPAVVAGLLTLRRLSINVSEQFTAGLVNLQLMRAEAALQDSEVLAPRKESLEQLLARAESRSQHGLALVVGKMDDQSLQLALAGEDRSVALRVRFGASRHGLRIRQELCAMMALNLVRRYLTDEDLDTSQGWIQIEESITGR